MQNVWVTFNYPQLTIFLVTSITGPFQIIKCPTQGTFKKLRR